VTLEAVILAAGSGSRFGRVTECQPKALIELDGEPLLFRMIRQCRAAGVATVNIVVGHFAEQVIERVSQEFEEGGFSFIHNDKYQTTNNILSLAVALDHVGERERDHPPELVVLECDVILDNNVLPLVVAHEAANIAVVSPYVAGLDGTVVKLAGNLVAEFLPTTKQGVDFDFSATFKTVNVYKFSPDFWSRKLVTLLHWYAEAIDSGSYYENVIGLVSYAGSSELDALVIASDAWHEVDDSNDLRKATGKFVSGPKYDLLTNAHGGWWDYALTDFYYLRNMHFPPPALLAQLRGSLVSALQNYGSRQEVLDEKVSWFLGTSPQQTLFLAGLSSLYPLLALELNRPETLVPCPSFGEYAQRFPEATSYHPYLSLADLTKLVTATGATTVFVVNPNNPAGTLHPTPGLVRAANTLPSVRFIIDESFLPFTAEASVADHTDELGSNVSVISSLSKTLGVPGLRVGYAWSKDLEWIRRYRQELPIWAGNSVAEQFISLLPKFKVEYRRSLVQTSADKVEFAKLLAAIPRVKVLPGADGNFINAMLSDHDADSSSAICEQFLDAGYLVKCVNEKLSLGHPVLRVAVRTADENQEFAAVLAEIAER